VVAVDHSHSTVFDKGYTKVIKFLVDWFAAILIAVVLFIGVQQAVTMYNKFETAIVYIEEQKVTPTS